MRFNLKRSQGIIELVTSTNRQSPLPISGVRVKRICELVMAAIRLRIRPRGRAQQSKPQHIPLGVISVFRFINQTEAMSSVTEVGPTKGRNLELGCLPTIVASCGTLNRSVRNLV